MEEKTDIYYRKNNDNTPNFHESLNLKKNRKSQIKFNIICTHDFEESIQNRKNSFSYKHWDDWNSFILNKYDLLNICEKMTEYWEKTYSTNEIEDILYKLTKNDTKHFEDVIESECKYNLMPNKIFIYNNDFALMFDRKYGTDESDDIIHNEIIYPCCEYN